MNNYIFGADKESNFGMGPRFFYALRRNDDGDLYLSKVDQMSNADSIQINKPADGNDDFTEFEYGSDFFEGRDIEHNLVFENLNYEQFRWDDRDIYYYINDNGEFVARINQKYVYPGPNNI